MLRTSRRIKTIGIPTTLSIFAVMAALTAALVVAQAAEARQIYVPVNPLLKDGMGSVNVIDTDSHRVTDTIDIGIATKPISAAVTPDGTRAYVASTWHDDVEAQSSFVTVIDTETNEIIGDPINLNMKEEVLIAPSLDGKYMFVGSTTGSFISVIDTSTKKVVRFVLFTDSLDNLRLQLRSIAVGVDGRLYVSGQPTGPGGAPDQIDPDTKPGIYMLPLSRIFDPDPRDENCGLVNGDELCVVLNAAEGLIEVDQPLGISLKPSGGRAWVGTLGSEVAVLDLDHSEVLERVQVNGRYVLSTAVNPDASRFYASTILGSDPRVNGGVTAYNTSPLSRAWASGSEFGVVDLAVMPKGDQIYYSNFRDDLDPGGKVSYMTSEGGVLGDIHVSGDPTQLAITPNQGPRADLNYEIGNGGQVSFDASGSSDPDGTVARYVWNFGDGSSATTDSPATTHRYADSGSYTTSVRVIDNEGGSTEFVSTGRTAMHNGSAAASTRVSFDVQAGAGDGNGAGGNGVGGGGVGGSGNGDDRCARPTYGLKVKTNRYVRAKDLKSGLKLGITATHSSKADIKVSLRRKEINRLGLFINSKKKRAVGTKNKVGLAIGREKQVKVPITGKLRKAISKKRSSGIPVKVEVVSRATGVPTWRKMERRVPVSAVITGKGRASKKKISHSAKVRGISPCAKRLNVGLKAPRNMRIKKSLKLQIKSSAKATGAVELSLRGTDRARLRLNRRFSKRLYRAKVRLAGGRELVKTVKLNRKTGSSLSRALRSQRMRVVRAKLVLDVTGEDGQSVRQAKTVRLVR